jgi:hypothetical protein
MAMSASAVWLKSLLPFVVMCFGGFIFSNITSD